MLPAVDRRPERRQGGRHGSTARRNWEASTQHPLPASGHADRHGPTEFHHSAGMASDPALRFQLAHTRAYGTGKLPIALADGRTFTLDLDELPVPEPDTDTR
ncbi:hypothetical protein O3Q52_37535 [Streptomyces sp. ActVer]|uniref:hypothetical protein n=1 Tax=Streptomyces sp. ActVer TaxID=3014558 RepID=UPI0022B52219|nr:hypothetical protein [Streptomyces sp. ActVer]MCZ4513750.1 hypothetical protein [Streptomyces sp. ActVer]